MTDLRESLSLSGGDGRSLKLRGIDTERDEPGHKPPTPQSDDGGNLNSRLTFKSFAEADSNSYALGRAKALALGNSLEYSPLQLTGPAGMGKTHLLHAIAHELSNAGRKVTLATAEEYTSDFVSAVSGRDGKGKQNKISDFKAKYRKIDALLIDGLDFFDSRSKPKSALELAEILNELDSKSKLVVITSRKNPLGLKLHEELKNRLQGGLPVRLSQPSQDDATVIVRHLTKTKGIKNLSVEAAATLARRRGSNVARLVSGINELSAYLEYYGREPTSDNVASALEMSSPAPEGAIEPSIVAQVVSDYFDRSWDEITSGRRTHDLTVPKHIAMYFLRQVCGLSVHQTVRFVGLKHHSAASRAVEEITKKIQSSPRDRDEIASLHEKINEAA